MWTWNEKGGGGVEDEGEDRRTSSIWFLTEPLNFQLKYEHSTLRTPNVPELSRPFSRNIAYKRDKSSPDDRTQLHSCGRH